MKQQTRSLEKSIIGNGGDALSEADGGDTISVLAPRELLLLSRSHSAGAVDDKLTGSRVKDELSGFAALAGDSGSNDIFQFFG